MTPTSTSCKKIHCTAVTKSPVKWYLRPTLNSSCHFLTVLNCFRHFYFTKKILVRKEKKLIQKVLITKPSYLKFQEDFKIKCLYQQIIYSSAHQTCTWIISLFVKLSKNRSNDFEVFSILPQDLIEAASENCSSWCHRRKHKQVFTFSNLFINTNLGNSHQLRNYSWK